MCSLIQERLHAEQLADGTHIEKSHILSVVPLFVIDGP